MNIALIKLLRDEFRNYNLSVFQKDLLAEARSCCAPSSRQSSASSTERS